MTPTSFPVSRAHDPYLLRDGIYVPPLPVVHNECEYDSRGFQTLCAMQRDHFWYRGRHRFLLHAVHRYVVGPTPRRVVDVGGGCGGWVDYLERHTRFPIAELALADSSEIGLRFAAQILSSAISRYQVDLLNLQWKDRWEVAFLLDVLEHIPDHEAALHQILDALVPGGLLFITVPALNVFWTWNDEVSRHQRRYRRSDFRRLADRCGFRLRDVRYFMFLLSPLLLATRVAASPGLRGMTEGQRQELASRMHRLPPPLINASLAAIFSCETPLGHLLHFPWGTSLLAVLQKPDP